MNNIYILILILILFLVLMYVDYIKIYFTDISYIIQQSLWNKKILNNNFSINNIEKVNTEDINNIKLLILSFDNRNINYIEDHNKNVKEYCKKHKNITYDFTTVTDKNVYWNKIYLVLEKLLTNNYDYVMWLDTDTIFVNNIVDIRNIIILYNSDILLSHDNDNLLSENTLNAGVFIIKNSTIGINFLKDIIYYFENSKCLNQDNKLIGIYGAKCYEQGNINNLIYNKYFKYTSILSTNIIYNTLMCNKNTFILHNYSGNNYDIKNCFSEINYKLNI